MYSIEVQLELGHTATLRTKPTPEGYTHDWTVYVRGLDGAEIQHFVEKIVFNLHESFPKHKRVVSKPPYEVSESGYAGFILPIEIFFRNKEEPKRVTLEYDLTLRLDDNVAFTRKEKITFQNPGPDFKKKLLKARGVLHDKSSTSTSLVTPPSTDKAYLQSSKGRSSHGSGFESSSSKKSSKVSGALAPGGASGSSSSVIPSKDKSHHSQHHTSSSSTIEQESGLGIHDKSSMQSLQNPFTELFGTPIRAKPSPDPGGGSRTKDHSKSSSSYGTNPSVNSKKSSQAGKSEDHRKSSSHEPKEKKHKSNKNGKETNATSVTTSSSTSASSSFESRKELSKSKVNKSSSSKSLNESTKAGSQRPSPLSSVESVNEKKSRSINTSASSTATTKTSSNSKKRRRSDSSGSPFTTLPPESSKKEKNSKVSSDAKDQETSSRSKKESSKRHKSSSKDMSTSNNASGNSSTHKAKDVKKESSTSTTISFSNNNNTGTTTLEIKSVMKEKTWDSEIKKTKNREQKIDETKVKEASSKESVSKMKTKGGSDDIKSPKIVGAKLLKVPKEKQHQHHLHTPMREASSSPASILSGSLTPGGATYANAPSSVSSVNCPISETPVNEMDHESLSPLSSSPDGDPVSPAHFDQNRGKETLNYSDEVSSDSDGEQPSRASSRAGEGPRRYSHHPDEPFENGGRSSDRNNLYPDPGDGDGRTKSNLSRKQQQQNNVADYAGHLANNGNSEGNVPGYFDTAYINELIILQRRISELTDPDVLQRIVDVIEESGLFTVTTSCFDFDLMKLDKSTVKKLKMCLAS